MQKSIGTAEQEVLQRMLVEAREKAGLTQRQLAIKLASGHSRVSDYERGQRRLDVVQLHDYLLAMGITPSEFVADFEKAVALLRADESGGEPGGSPG